VGRKAGGAVARNRVKRLLREAARASLEGANGCDFVVVARARAKDASFDEMCASMRRLLARLEPETPRGDNKA